MYPIITMSSINEISDDPILYELLEYFVRKQEPELIKCKTDTAILPTTGTIKNALRYLNNRYSLPEGVSQQVSLTLPWKFAVGDYGRLLAILQENVIEIRKAKDEYSSVIGKASVPKDAFPQWRKLVWSPDGSILVLASSNGHVSFYNSLGNNIFSICPKTITQNPHVLEAGDAIASIIFLKPRTQHDTWSYELILITYSGLLKSYHISVSNGYNANYEFSFGNFYKNGINAVAYDTKRSLFYVAGNTITQKLTSTASKSGLTSWRLLNDYPYCKLSIAFQEDTEPASIFSLWNLIPTFNFQTETIIFKMRISPNGEFLTCLHSDGSVSLWGLPNFLFQRKWRLTEQPDYNVPNPLRLTKCKKFPPGLTEFHPVDIGWWSDQAIIIARYSGSTSVCCIKNLKNLLGISPEFLAGQPQIAELGTDRGFLCLDCETFITSKKRSRDASNEGQISEVSSESEKEDDELEPMTILNYTTTLVQSTLYSITDIEKFQPKRKKSKVLYRTYRILGLKSTTPEELYSRKIDIEEYDEALALANTYNLDTDLVYQTQWRKSELSLNAIQEHLSKVTKRSWVLNECVTRVPDTMEAARELLNFGLKGANVETLLAIGECDNGKFVLEDDENWEDLDEQSVCLRQVQKVNDMLEKIDIQNLSEAQKDLIRYRRKLLDHLDKLLTYEIILEPSQKYDKIFYEEFRQLTAVENAIRFAKDGDCRGVEIMFTYYGEKLLPHWLAILSFFPETLNPSSYQKLLPECDTEGQLFLLDQRELRQKDWSEKPEFNEVINMDSDDQSQLLYDGDASLSIYRNTELTPYLLHKWYKSRAYQIERNSFMVENALQLVKIAKSHNITGLEELLLDLETLDDMIYRVYLEEMSLDQLEKLNNLEKIKLLMSMSSEESFVDDLKYLLLSFIKRRHQYLGGDIQKHFLSDYLISLSKDDLSLPVIFFEHLKQTSDSDIMHMIDDFASLALNCIYACHDTDMLEKAQTILACIPKDYTDCRGHASTMTTPNLIEELEKELDCVKILSKYDVKTTLNFVRKNKNDPNSVKQLLVQMARSLNKKIPPPDEDQWAQLLNEMLEIHGLVFSCIDVEICFEICVSARLVSGVKDNIQNCSALIETTKNEQSLLKVTYDKAVSLILEACVEYFNSSKSLTDYNMELAKACLHLIEDNNTRIKEEYDLINSLQILHEFNIDMLPFQVRLTQDRLKLIEECLNARAEAYKSRQRLLTLANYLRIEEKNTRIREGKILELIAKKAFDVGDYSVCAATCQQLMQSNYVPAWTVALNLGYCTEYQDLFTRKKCLSFALNNGPTEILAKVLDHLRLIDIQLLHKDLELWMPSTDFEDFQDAADSDDEFTDAMTTPQVEKKDFVPKIIETSTEMVKSSASMMKESTFGLIRNISDTSFWKSRLKFNFAGEGIEAYNDTEEKKSLDMQSFPCFYESIHKNCNISDLDTKYDRYSMPDVDNTKLKCCQALLRIAVLSESYCTDVEGSDINHLFVECAKHTLSEDWLLGVAYLLNLNKNCIENAQAVFATLPENELYLETAAYYYALELYKKLHDDTSNLYLCNPLTLIQEALRVAQSCGESEIRQALLNSQVHLKKYKAEVMNDHKTETTNRIKEEHVEPIEEKKGLDLSAKQIAKTITKDDDITNETEDVNLEEQNDNINSASQSRDVDWAQDWGDFSDDGGEETVLNNQTSSSTIDILPHKRNESPIISHAEDCTTEEECFRMFQKMFNKISTHEHYKNIKGILFQWEKFTSPEYTGADTHPVLRLMKIVPVCITKMDTANYANQILVEYKDLVERLSSTSVLREFFKKDIQPMTVEHAIYIRLCTIDPILHEEAVNIIKEKYKETPLPCPILEELFLKDFTAAFSPNHSVFNQIIEHVFVNRSLTNIDEHAKTLVNKLKEHKHIGQALTVIGLMEDIPTSMRTFDTCFNLLIRK